MDVSLNSITYKELACSEESPNKNTKEITIDDVLEFIKNNGHLYEDEINKSIIEAKENDRSKMMRIVNRRRSMYERLSKLWLL